MKDDDVLPGDPCLVLLRMRTPPQPAETEDETSRLFLYRQKVFRCSGERLLEKRLNSLEEPSNLLKRLAGEFVSNGTFD